MGSGCVSVCVCESACVCVFSDVQGKGPRGKEPRLLREVAGPVGGDPTGCGAEPFSGLPDATLPLVEA